MTAPPAVNWHALPAAEALNHFQSGAAGLTTAEAAARLASHGRNELTAPPAINPWVLLLGQFKSLIIWILIGAATITGILGEWVDCIAIVAIVVLNALIGFYQEWNAEKSIAALRRLTSPQARVRRDGRALLVPAAEVVPGDLLELEAGDLIAADARLLDAGLLRCIEAALTGESDAVEKSPAAVIAADAPPGDRLNMVFMGTAVAAGQGRAVVTGTGMNSELGRIAQLLQTAAVEESQTPLQQRLAALGRSLVRACLGIVALLFVLGLLRGSAPFELFLTSVSLAVAAVPEGLPAVVTVALGLGVLRMSRRRALVRRLPAVETLGSASVICTDKTGTLTVGQMTVREIYVAGTTFAVTGEGYGPHGEILLEGRAAPAALAPPLLELAEILIGCNNAELMLEDGTWRVVGDPTEAALLLAGGKTGTTTREQIDRDQPRHHEIPFDSDRKRRTVVRLRPDGSLRVQINGAPDMLLDHCTRILTADGVVPLTEDERERLRAANASMAGRALRVLGSAWRDIDHAAPEALTAESVERDLIFAGLTGMHDPPRPEVRDALAKCRSAGIRVVMITGDHPATAIAIARELEIAAGADAVLTGARLDTMDDRALEAAIPDTAVFARVTAAHKLRIVRAWQATGAVVAMTGDGVNDAPAIRGADIGIAMGISGTEVTKQASDMIVTDDNFATIIAAVEEGRGIYNNIRKTLIYLLSGNCGELLLMTAAIIAGLPAPLLPIHLLWINLVTDGLPALCLAADPIGPDVMQRPPRPRGTSLTDRGFLVSLAATGILTAVVTLAVFVWQLRTAGLEAARTHAFATLVFSELLRAFGARSDTVPFWRVPLLSNLWLLAVVTFSVSLQLFSHHSPWLAGLLRTSLLPFSDGLLLLAAGALPLIVLQWRYSGPGRRFVNSLSP